MQTHLCVGCRPFAMIVCACVLPHNPAYTHTVGERKVCDSYNCDLEKNSQFAIIRDLHLKRVYANPLIALNVLRKPRPRVAVFYVFCTLPASGRFASEGSFVSFLVCFCARYYCTLRSLASRNKEPRLLSSRNSCTHTCNREQYAAALATGNSAKTKQRLVSMRSYREERSLRTRHGIRGLFAQS